MSTGGGMEGGSELALSNGWVVAGGRHTSSTMCQPRAEGKVSAEGGSHVARMVTYKKLESRHNRQTPTTSCVVCGWWFVVLSLLSALSPLSAAKRPLFLVRAAEQHGAHDTGQRASSERDDDRW